MRICFMTMGSRGDVQPYLAIAKELVKNGHSAVIATGESFRDFILENNVEFHRINLDLNALSKYDKAKKFIDHPILNFARSVQLIKKHVILPYRSSLEDFYEAAQGADIIIYNPLMSGANDIAEKLGIKAYCMSPVPMHGEEIMLLPNYPKWINQLSFKFLELVEIVQIKNINSFRENVLNLPCRKVQTNFTKNTIIYLMSPHMFSNITSWKDHVFVAGFCFLESDEKLQPETEEFLDKKPIIVTFGSIGRLKNLPKLLEKYLEETDNYAVTLGGGFASSARILALDKAPHDSLLKKAKGIIHHGGAGTTAAALREGVPQVIIPFAVDQPFWANEVFKLGCSIEPVNKNGYKNLLNAIKSLDDEQIIKRAEEISKIIKSEKGVENCIRFFESLAPEKEFSFEEDCGKSEDMLAE